MKAQRPYLIAAFLFVLFSCRQKDDWAFSKVSGQNVLFTNGKVFNTSLNSLKYIGQIPVPYRAPYLILAGVYCDGCDANLSLYVHSPSDGPLLTGNGKNRYAYPGTENDYETGALLSRCRFFYGEVLPGRIGAIWYTEVPIGDGKFDRSAFFLEVGSGKKLKNVLTYKDNLSRTLKLLKQGKCRELPGEEFTSEP
jgi:hypothetical protein